jgi:hypothetical protein
LNQAQSDKVAAELALHLRQFLAIRKLNDLALAKRRHDVLSELRRDDLREVFLEGPDVPYFPNIIGIRKGELKTDSMERRYNIVDTEDLSIAKEFMERRTKAAETVTEV